MRADALRAHLLPGSVLAVAIAALLACFLDSRIQTAAFDQNLAYQQALRDELSGMQRDRRIFEALLPDYRALSAAGAFQREDRLAWINAVDRTVGDLNLPHVRYLVYPQTSHVDPSLPSDGAWDVRASRMRLELGLTHTGELLDFLASVQARVRGTLHINGCDLQRRVAGSDFLPTLSNVNAVCEVDWLTLESRAKGFADDAV